MPSLIFSCFSAPVKESPTIYDAFLGKKSDKEQVKPNHSNGDVAAANTKKVQKKKSNVGEKRKETLTLEQAIKRVYYDI